MLTEGKPKASDYYVFWYDDFDHSYHHECFPSINAQRAVDYVRKNYPDVEITEVAKVVNNWK